MNGALPALLAGCGTALVVGALLRRDPLPAVRRRGPAQVPGLDHLERRLSRAGVSASAPVAAGMLLAATAAASLLAAAAGSPGVALAAPGAVPLCAHLWLAGRERRYPERAAAQLPGLLRGTADGIAAGRSLRRALARAAQAAPEPIATEVGLLVDHLELGGRIDTGLAELVRRCPAPEFELLRGAILVNAGGGGNLARVLGDLGTRLDDRRRLTRELRGLGEQARMTAWLVGGLPALGGLAVELTAPGVLARALVHGPGRISLVVAAGLMCASVFLIRRIGRP